MGGVAVMVFAGGWLADIRGTMYSMYISGDPTDRYLIHFANAKVTVKENDAKESIPYI
ncbi:MAG: hypothetical protein ACLVJO_02670 [[Clostridium] scindens]